MPRMRHVLLSILLSLTLAACSRQTNVSQTSTAVPFELLTADPTRLATVQAQAAMTAAWVGTRQAELVTPTPPLPTPIPVALDATPASQLVGECPTFADGELHIRGSFCIAAPAGWTALNFDGGMAGTLGTTPGQAITLEPPWAETSLVCQVTIFILTGETALDHLNSRYTEFRNNPSVDSLETIQALALADIAVFGFTYGGQRPGGVYAADVGQGETVHIGYRGSNCPVDDLLPVLRTLRFNQ